MELSCAWSDACSDERAYGKAARLNLLQYARLALQPTMHVRSNHLHLGPGKPMPPTRCLDQRANSHVAAAECP